MILVIDNYDSFTYNIVQLVGKVTPDIVVKRNDDVTVEEIERLQPTGIIISPGPGRPEDAGVSVDTIRQCGHHLAILGICLGHQAIGQAFGCRVVHAPSLMHGRTSAIAHTGSSLFEGIQSPFTATRYHSLIISKDSLPPDLEVTAQTTEGVIMGIKHRKFPIEGVQFHPESILTIVGERIIGNWLKVQKC